MESLPKVHSHSNLALPLTLRNQYFIFRHGHSQPNGRHVICSDPALGLLPENGLSPVGVSQVRESARTLRKHLLNVLKPQSSRTVVVVSSPFSRAKETAEIVHAELASDSAIKVFPDVVEDGELRERYFGSLDQQTDDKYPLVWQEDSSDDAHTRFDVESLRSVWRRVRSLVLRLEDSEEPCIVILVAHGDTLQITQAAFAGMSLCQHRQVPHLKQAEWRNMVRAPIAHSKL